MHKTFIACATVAALLTTPVFAGDFYVTHRHNSTQCHVTTMRPNGKTWVMVGSHHKTRKAAERAMRAAPCSK